MQRHTFLLISYHGRPGSQIKKRADGRYCCKYKGKYFYGRSPEEAKQLRKDYIRAEESGRALVRVLTVREYCEKWLPLYKSGVSEKCYNDYAKQHSKMAQYFVSQVKLIAAPILKHEITSELATDKAENLITSSAIISGFSQLLAEKLLLLNPPEQQEL